MAQNIGKVVQVIGPVVDVKFQKDKLPKLNNAVNIELNGHTLVIEVAQRFG
ncbi:MAG: F-type H+/Na+-transporting ATPase subunit beta [Acetobacterium sp.]|nr:F-type H+/Na+-transporting ATPase subunit beta [Acetobacterium sp.]